MSSKQIKKWFFTHQVETLIIAVSILALIIGTIAVGWIAILIVLILDGLIFFGPTLQKKILNLLNKNKKKEESDENMAKKKKKENTSISAKKSTSKKEVSNVKNTKVKEKNTKPVKETKKKKKRTSILKIFFIFIFICFILGLVAAGLFFFYIASNAPKFDPNELYSAETTLVYANDGKTVIAKLGAEKREKITYDELPEVFINALIATEDSRFFQHNGFDLPRFAKAAVGQLLGNSNAGGASTITMQISKNAFTSTEDEGIEGIIRKFTDIYLSIFQIEKEYSKQEIIEFYVNNNLLGGNNYGVEQASLTYFGKHAKDMNLSEAALIAGMFQSPNAYNPLTKPENAAYRRNIVLTLMVRHGYITKAEADAANAIPIEELTKNGSGNSDDTDYQGFIDTVVSEIKQDTKANPYTTSMEIYTTMDIKKQDAINKIMSGETHHWQNDKAQAGIVVLDTKTGAIVAVGTNRDDSQVGLLNHATFENQTKRQIGSTAKPLFAYGPAIEYNNASPGMLVADEVYSYSDGNPINNFDAGYQGLITYRVALAGSRNIPALKVFQSVKKSSIIDFTTKLGLSPELSGNSLHEAHAIGGYNGESPLTVAAAYAAIGNKGVYNETYSYTKIVYRDTGEEYVKEHGSERAMSEATAYILTDMLISTAPSALLNYSNVNGWKFAAKTGTSNFTEETKKANGLADNAINDLWVAAYNDEYTISVWYGYDKIYQDAYTRFGDTSHMELFNKVAHSVWTRPIKTDKPDDVVEVTIEAGAVTPKLPSQYTPDYLRTVELFRKGSEPTEVSNRFSKLNNVKNLKASSSNGEITLSWDAIKDDWNNSGFLHQYFRPVFKNDQFLGSHVYTYLENNKASLGNLTYYIYVLNSSTGNYEKIGSTADTSYTFEPDSRGTETYLVRAAYSNFQSTQSSGTTITAKVVGFPVSYTVSAKSTTIEKGETYDYEKLVYVSDSNACSLKTIYLNSVSYDNSWANVNSAISKLEAGEHALAVTYNCGKKTLSSKATITVIEKKLDN